MTRRIAFIFATLFSLMSFTTAYASGPGHDHGKADLALGIEGQDLTVTFVADLNDLVGFESAPRTVAEEEAIAELETRLSKTATLVDIPSNAQCEYKSAAISGLPSTSAADEQGHHFFITAIHMLSCASANRLNEVTVTAFDSFPALEKINAIAFTENGQRGDILTPASPTFRLK